MSLTVHRWNRATLLARLAASEAIDALAATDPVASAKDRLRLLNVGDRFEAGAMSDADIIAEFEAIRAAALAAARTTVPVRH